MKNVIFWFSFSIVIAVYSIYTNYKEQKSLNNELTSLKEVIELKEHELTRYQQISEKAEAEKLRLENKSIELIEQLNNALKNNKCSNEPVPAVIADKLYDKAHRIRQAAKNSSEFTYRLPATIAAKRTDVW